MDNTSKSIFFNLSEDGSFDTLIKPYCINSEINTIIDSGAFNYLCDIHKNTYRLWYFITEDGGPNHITEDEVPKELLAYILLI